MVASPAESRRSRILAMQALCQWDVQQDSSAEFLSSTLAAHDLPETSAENVTEVAAALVRAVWEKREDIDRMISEASAGWSLSRISPVERNILRVAVVELLEARAPTRVVLNEAIEIGKEYGGAESPRFINGLLDQILRTLPSKSSEDATD